MTPLLFARRLRQLQEITQTSNAELARFLGCRAQIVRGWRSEQNRCLPVQWHAALRWLEECRQLIRLEPERLPTSQLPIEKELAKDAVLENISGTLIVALQKKRITWLALRPRGAKVLVREHCVGPDVYRNIDRIQEGDYVAVCGPVFRTTTRERAVLAQRIKINRMRAPKYGQYEGYGFPNTGNHHAYSRPWSARRT